MKRVLLCADEHVLGTVMENILALEGDLEVIRIVVGDKAELLQAVVQYAPEAIILDENTVEGDKTLLTCLLSKNPKLCVITVSPEHNWLHLYRKQEVWISHASDLAGVIRGQ